MTVVTTPAGVGRWDGRLGGVAHRAQGSASRRSVTARGRRGARTVEARAIAPERDQAAPVLAAIDPARRLDLVGTTDALEAGACLARCALFIGNDSGLMHVAAAVGTPTLGLFGPSRPEHYRPWGPHCAYLRTPQSIEELLADPDYDPDTTGTLMDGLEVGMVADAAAALWRRAGVGAG